MCSQKTSGRRLNGINLEQALGQTEKGVECSKIGIKLTCYREPRPRRSWRLGAALSSLCSRPPDLIPQAMLVEVRMQHCPEMLCKRPVSFCGFQNDHLLAENAAVMADFFGEIGLGNKELLSIKMYC